MAGGRDRIRNREGVGQRGTGNREMVGGTEKREPEGREWKEKSWKGEGGAGGERMEGKELEGRGRELEGREWKEKGWKGAGGERDGKERLERRGTESRRRGKGTGKEKAAGKRGFKAEGPAPGVLRFRP